MTEDKDKLIQDKSVQGTDIEENLVLEDELTEEEMQMLINQANDFLETAKKIN